MNCYFDLPEITFGQAGTYSDDYEMAGRDATPIIENTKRDVKNLIPITDSSAELAKTIAEQMRLILYNAYQANTAYTHTSKTLEGLSVDFGRSVAMTNLDVDIKNKIENDKKILITIQQELQKNGAQIQINPGGMTKMQQWLREVQKIHRENVAIFKNLSKVHSELQTIKAKLKDTQKTSSDFNDSSIVAVSNVSILFMYVDELRTKSNSSLYISLVSYFPEIAQILKLWPDFKRVAPNGLFIAEPNPAPVIPANYLQDTRFNAAAVASLEQQLAKILNSFWANNSNELEKMQAECFKKYRPPFGYIQDLPDNIFINAIARACQRTGDDKLRLMLSASGGSEDGVKTLFTSNGSMLKITTAGGSICGCQLSSPELNAFPSKRPKPLGQAYGTIKTAGRDSGDEDSEDDDDDDDLFSPPAQKSSKTCSSAYGDDMYTNLYAGRTAQSKRHAARHAARNAARNVAKKALSADYLSADLMAGTIYRALVEIVNQAIMYANSSIKALPETIGAMMSLMAALENLNSLQCLISNKIDAPYTTYGLIRDLIITFDHNITLNDEANPMFRMNQDTTINVLKNAVPLFDNYKVPENVMILPKDMWRTSHQGLVKIYNACLKQLMSVILSRLTATSIYHNKATIGSIGVINEDDQSFFIDPNLDNKVVVFKQDPALENELAVFKNKIAANYINDKLNLYTRNRQKIADSLANATTVLNTAYNKLKDVSDAFTRAADTKWGPNLPAIFKAIVKARSFCSRQELAEDSTLNNLFTKIQTEKGLDDIQTISWIKPEDLNAEKFGPLSSTLSSVGCLFHGKVTYYSGPHKSAVEPFSALYDVLVKLKDIPDENIVFTDTIAEPLSFKGNFTAIDAQIEQLKQQTKDLDALKLSALEKRFSTPVIGVHEQITDMMSKYGYKYMLEQPFSINLFMMGPSGSGKSFNQYGVPGRKGIDSVLLALPDITTTYFRDSYHLSFGFPESITQAARGPIIYNYKLDGSGSLETVVGATPFPITRDKLKNDYYNIQLKPMRLAKKLIRTTENNDESSRSFLVTSVKDSQNNIKCLVDSPGFEVIPQENIAFTNPFLQIFYLVVSYVHPMSPLVQANRHTLIDQTAFENSEREWVTVSMRELVSKFESFGLTEDHLAKVRNESMPIPSDLKWADNGIETCTFDSFINSAFLACPIMAEKWVGFGPTITAVDDNIEIWLTFPDGQELISKTTNRAWSQSSEKNRLSTKQTQNLVVDRQLAYAIMWTWAIYKQFAAGPNSNAASSVNSSASTNSYSSRIIELIDMVSRVYGAGAAQVQAHARMKLTLEALFINQFNLWVSDSTSKLQSKSIDQFLAQTKSVAAPPSTEKQTFYDFILTVSDMRLKNINATIDRYRYQENLGYELLFDAKQNFPGSYELRSENTAFTTKKIASSYISLYDDLPSYISKLNNSYNLHNRSFSLYFKMSNNIELFNTFLTKNTKNLFFYILNAKKADKYFPFLDINMDNIAAAAALPPPPPPPPRA